MPNPSFLPRAPRAILAAVLTLVGAGLAVTPVATAGTYTAWLCKTPPGTPAPLGQNAATSTYGWLPDTSAGGHVVIGDSCGGGGDGNLSVNFVLPDGSSPGTMPGSRWGWWKFTAPSGTYVSTVRLQYGYGVTANNNAQDYYGEPGISFNREGAVYPAPAVYTRLLTQTGVEFSSGALDLTINSSTFGFNTGCYGSGQCGTSPHGRSSVGVGWQQINLVDDSTPTASNIGGSIMDAGTKKGIETFRFDAADSGSGARAVAVTLDGAVAAPVQLIVPSDKRCEGIETSPSIDREFAYAQPCPNAASGLISVDTKKVADGERLLTAYVYDAAGNQTAVASKKVTVQNTPTPAATPAASVPTPTPAATVPTPTPGPGVLVPGVVSPGTSGTAGLPNGAGGSPATGRVIGLVAPKSPTAFGKPLSLTGKVVDGTGAPLRGAFVDVFTTLDIPGAPRVFAGTVTADGSGAFTYAVTTKASLTVEFAYAAKQASSDYVDQAKVAVAVQASVSFALPKQASRGNPVRFSGVVGVDPLPKKGARVVIELRDGKRWRDTKTVRTGAGGVFGWSYRFKTRGSFTFRARLLSAVDVPAKRNQSTTRTVRIR